MTENTMRTFFTVEIVHGLSAEMNDLACTIVQLGVEGAIACARMQMLNRKNHPEILLHSHKDVEA